jgi:hypothetical protein
MTPDGIILVPETGRSLLTGQTRDAIFLPCASRDAHFRQGEVQHKASSFDFSLSPKFSFCLLQKCTVIGKCFQI